MEKTIIDAIRSALPTVEVYHDFAPDDAGSPLVVLQRVGGAGNLFIDNATPGGYQIRLQLAVWAVSRLEAVSLSLRIEKALAALPGGIGNGTGFGTPAGGVGLCRRYTGGSGE